MPKIYIIIPTYNESENLPNLIHAVAENLKVPYIIIMGQKEALENAVIVRNMANRSQTVVPIPKLADYLKHLRG